MSKKEGSYSTFKGSPASQGILQFDMWNIKPSNRYNWKDLKDQIAKKPKPIILECMTFRMRGHEEASGIKYIPKEIMEEWAKNDTIKNYETNLLKEGILLKKI